VVRLGSVEGAGRGRVRVVLPEGHPFFTRLA